MKTLITFSTILALTLSFRLAPAQEGEPRAAHPAKWPHPGPAGVVKSLNGLTGHVTLTAGSNVTLVPLGNGFQIQASAPGTVSADTGWSRTGNAAAPGEFLGTINPAPLEIRVNNDRVLRLEPNEAGPNVIAGFRGNQAWGAVGATVAGGGTGADFFSGLAKPNEVGSAYGTVGGGLGNRIAGFLGFASTIGGGDSNRIAGHDAVIGGGYGNAIGVNAGGASIDGGYQNTIEEYASSASIGGGLFNVISAFAGDSTIGGGRVNSIRSNAWGTVIAGGVANQVGEAAVWSTIGGGHANFIAANAMGATIPGGYANFVSGSFSLAAGQRAFAHHDGCFVWSDSNPFLVHSTGSNQFTVRASGGVRLYSAADLSAGVELAPGAGAWSTLSDRRMKEHCAPVDVRQVLDRVVGLSLQTWNLKSQDPSIRHLGPMSQDFHAAFGVGEDERHIATVDADGVALAAIQGLHQVVQEQQIELENQQHINRSLQKELDTLRAELGSRLRALEEARNGAKSE